MTWRKSIQTLIKHPMYLVITLLPLLLIAMLLMPLLEQIKNFVQVAVESGIAAGHFTYYDSPDFLENEALFGGIFAMMGSIMLISVAGLVTQLIFTPIALQYLGEATLLGHVPVGYAGRGLKRLWWKPFVFSALLSLALYFVALPMAFGTLGTSALLLSPFGIGAALFVFLAFGAIIFLVQTVTEMFHASAAMENLPFFTSVGRAFKRTFSRNIGRFLGAAAICVGIAIIAYIVLLSSFMGSAMEKIIAIEQSSRVPDAQMALSMIDEWLTRLSTSMIFMMLVAWLTGSFFTSYCFHITGETIQENKAPVVATEQPADAGAEAKSPDDSQSASEPASFESYVQPESQDDASDPNP